MDRPSYLPPPTRWIIQIHQLTATISLRRMHATRLLVHRGNKNRGRVFAAYAFARKIAFTFMKNRFPPPLGFVSTSLCRFSFQRWAWILETGLLGRKGVESIGRAAESTLITINNNLSLGEIDSFHN